MRRLLVVLGAFAGLAFLTLPAMAGEQEAFRAEIAEGDAVMGEAGDALFDHYTMYFESDSAYELEVDTRTFRPTLTVVDIESDTVVASVTRKVGGPIRLEVQVARSDTYMVMVVAEDGGTGLYDIRIEEID